MTSTSPTPVQRQWVFPNPGEPLASVEAARRELVVLEDEVIYLIEDRQLPAFNLSLKTEGKRHVRIWWPGLVSLRDRKTPLTAETETITNDVLAGRDRLHLTELTTMLILSSTHVHHLIEAKFLERVPGVGDRVNKGPLVTRASVVNFLKERRM